MRKVLLLLVALLACGLIAAGCGGDDGDDSEEAAAGQTETAQDALTKQEYIAEAERLCAPVVEPLEAEFNEITDPAQGAAFLRDEFAPLARELVADLREIPAPAGDEDALADVYDKFDQGFDEIENDPSGVNEGTPPLQEAEMAARQAGYPELADCGTQD